MRSTFTRKQTGLAMACALALGILSATLSAQVPSGEKAALVDARGAPVMSDFGLCARRGFGPAPSWTAGCHAEVPVPVAPYAAPAAAPDSQSLMANGYADRMGTPASKQVLSQQRVDAAKAYPAGKRIASSRVQTSARGETQRSTLVGECKDANNANNVACTGIAK